MSKDTGGYAYPRSVWKGDSDNYTDKETGGMTLRDYFAGQALVGIMSQIEIIDCDTDNYVSRVAYKIADAMITERGRDE